MEKILVTGGAGFIGSHVTEALVKRGHQVTVLDDLSGGYTENIVDGASFVQGSITDIRLVNSLFAERQFTCVYHLAAYAAEGLSHFIRHFNYTNNLIGSINLINASVNNGVRCFVFTSSIAIYGASPELPMTEETRPYPEDPYGVAKLAVEQDLLAAKHMFGMDFIIFRPHNVYGERQNIADKYRNVVGIFMNQILQGKPMSVFGDGSQTRAFSYIGDMAPIMADAIDTPAAYNQIFNIGADQPYTINELAHAIARAMGVEPNIAYLPARNEVLNAFSSHEKLDRIFGQRRLHTLDEGLANMAAWVRTHGARSSSRFEGIEVEKNFPKAWLV
ncbi:MAG TPA: NAD-dependent epimerase/dehydratase family protein [Roseiflexaceae bacterium]|nr:NAD-dependent epimerase/dehydratase family protein [Roseiflexaceae bacterium]HMP39249.1 NAD-dependent epimerase/dehydratase family protein [Roseiflexaceae bacterium]